MAKCPFCDHFNRTGATQCEKCKAPLQTSIPNGADAVQAAPEPAPEPGSLEADILGLMQGRKKIEAVRLYRERAHVGLKEAKDFVEALAAKHGIDPGSSGCGGVVLLMIVAGAATASVIWTCAAMVS